MFDFLQNNYWWVVPSGGLIVATVALIGKMVKWGAKTVEAIKDIVVTLQPALQKSSLTNGSSGAGLTVVESLITNLPEMSSSLKSIAAAMHDDQNRPYLKKIAETTTRTDGRSKRTHELLEQAVAKQQKHYKAIDNITKSKRR